MTYAQTMKYINHFGHTGAPVTDLSRMETLLEALGNPHRQLKFVHIAGTNGKGSTLTYCAEASMTAGIQTGMFTSPYILCYEDRIRVNGENIPRDALCRLGEQVRKHAPELPFSMRARVYSDAEDAANRAGDFKMAYTAARKKLELLELAKK